MEKGYSLQQMVLGKLDKHMLKNKIEPHFTSFTKINSKWSDLNIRPDSIKLEENVEKRLLNISLGNDFWDMTPKVQIRKAKVNKWATSN